MNIDWHAVLVPETSLLELILRGTVMYIALLAALRVLVRRHIGSMSLMDLLLMVLIADAAQNGMADEYRSLTEGAVLCEALYFAELYSHGIICSTGFRIATNGSSAFWSQLPFQSFRMERC